jgi:hypothetical protein
MDAEGLPSDFVELLRTRGGRVLPCVGAGLSVPAGIRDLASDLIRTAVSRGVKVDAADLSSVVQALESQCGVEETQKMVAETITATPVNPTTTHRALALCPTRIVATFNYDSCLELAAEQVGRTPRALLPNTADAFRHPGPDELVVLHLHGAATNPGSIVLPGRTTERLRTHELFMRVVTALWAQYIVVYFGFSFAPTEVHLFDALDWVARELPGADTQHLLLREPEAQERGEQLASLVEAGLFEVVPYPDTPDHRAVHQAALLLAPTNEPAADNVRRGAAEPAPHYEAPALLEIEPGADPTTIKAETIRADWGMGAGWVTIPELLDTRRAVVIAPPGMGKTQLLRVSGREPGRTEKALLISLKDLLGLLDADEDPVRAFARLVGDASAFDSATPVPSRERLEGGSYMFLLDALDEVPPGRRAEVIDAVLAAADRWPQHGYVVATRPTVDAGSLIGRGFRSFRIVSSSGWGNRYLERRGVPRSRVEELRARAPAAANLLAIPTYAAAIAERLVEGIEPSDRPIDLLLDPVRTLARIEAEKQGKPSALYVGWLQRLAVGLELLGRSDASTAELAELPGPEPEDAQTARERLVQAALLVDVPDRAEFPERTVQEALCAEALLGCEDVVAAVRAVAVGDLAGGEALRGDIDHCLDQVWANAADAQRAALRELDELRWARTIRPDCSPAGAEEALGVIWDWHRERRVWMNWAAQGELRGAQDAVTLLAESHPDVIRQRRDELIGATRSDQPTTRGNAMAILAELGRDEGTVEWLLPLLEDNNDVVRRQAVGEVARLEVTEALPVMREMVASRTDRSEAEAFARSLVKLTPDSELGTVANILREDGRLWATVSGELDARLSLDDALTVLHAGLASRDEHLKLLRRTLGRHSPEAWGSERVERLAAGLVRNDVQEYEDVDVPRLTAVVGGQPEAALRGVRDGAQNAEVHWTNLFFVEPLDDQLLRTQRDGPLRDAYTMLLERKAARAQGRGGATTGQAARQATARGGPPAAPTEEASATLGRQLDDGEIREDRVPQNLLSWPVEDLTAPQRERLAELVETWWPERPLPEVIRKTAAGVEFDNGALAAVCAGAALDLRLSDERWLDVLSAAGAMYQQPEVVSWLHRQHRVELDERGAEVIRASDDDWHLYYAIGAFASLNAVVALAFVERLPVVEDPHRFDALVQTLVSAGHRELLHTLDETQLGEARRHALLEALAAAGEVESQRPLIQEALQKTRNGEPSPPLRFAHAVTDEQLVEPLAELLGLLGPSSGGARDDLQRSVVQALAATRSVAALRAYDQLMADGSFDSAFFWYPRNELARTMAREQVLARLPQRVRDVPQVVEEQGWRPARSV